MYFAGQLGVTSTEVWPHYDSFNERVILAILNVAVRCSEPAFCYRLGVILPLRKPLPTLPSGAIMKRR